MANLCFRKFLFFYLLVVSCQGQNSPVVKDQQVPPIIGGGCDGCEIMFVGMPDIISPESISEGWENGKTPLMITGTVYKRDGRTPAPGTVIYFWHTDDRGLYSAMATTPKEAIRHGYLRGWVKSDQDGHYTIKTSRPAPYPNEDMAAHIHLSIKEPQLAYPYYADLYLDDDPKYLLHKKKFGVINRAGTEVLRVLLDNHIQVAEHNIILGLNIPDYPATPVAGVHSGLNIGEDQPSFIPYHAFGADKGSQACPVCKYGRYHGVLFSFNDFLLSSGTANAENKIY